MLSKVQSVFIRKKMSAVDNAWLRMDSNGNLMMIVGVAMLDKPVSIQGLKRTLTDRLLAYRRFRSRVVADVSGTWWQEQDVDLEDHVVHLRLASAQSNTQSNKPALEHLVGKLSEQPLNPYKPLWQMHLVDNCVGEDGKVRQALIVRIHHCIGDGIALVGVFMSMFSGAPDEQERQTAHRAGEAVKESSWSQILMPVTQASIKAIKLSSAMLTKYLGLFGDPHKMGEEISELGHSAAQLAIDAIKLSAMTEDSPTRLKGKPSGRKHVAWSEPLPLAEVKAIGKAYGCSINDVLMACVAGAIRGYLRHKGDEVAHDCELRAMIPVNLRGPGTKQKLGNAFGLVPLVLPIGIEDPIGRLFEVRHRMKELKGGYTALLAMFILGALGSTPKQVQTEIQNYFAKKATAVMSNVPGPHDPLYLAGSKLDQVMFWVPQSGDIGVGVSILSYNGGVQFGIVIDDAIAKDPEEIIGRFAPEFEKLVLLALMGEEWS